MKRKKKEYHCNCWQCMTAKEKKVIAREKEKRLFRCGSRSIQKSVFGVNTSVRDGI